ncbi:uncharacterized protein LOC110919095 [Helianthus annuus]|uniref:uncharacterized protein LOC110919095 n=1 Tax=Helianthus annuus TaxID=4232 RepID=UPI000B907B63|nr:uncharacterized protein LOC110919095 [Helianthus annuus]
MSWGWRKILSLRGVVRPFIWKVVRSGAQTNIWWDNWCHISPLSAFISPRRITNAGFNIASSVLELVDENGNWSWPQAWYDIYPVLIGLNAPQLMQGMVDRTVWKDLDGNMCSFSSSEVWHAVRSRHDQVLWGDGIWFSQCIPRHSFHLWLVVKNKLKTQDRLAVWEAGSATNLNLMCCPLCRTNRDSRDHLFFQCSFASKVWNEVKTMVQMGNVDSSWQSIMTWMECNASSKRTDHIICKLVIAASTYFVWQERNNCLFSNAFADQKVVIQKIKETVRLRLMGFKFRRQPSIESILRTWKIGSNDETNDPG